MANENTQIVLVAVQVAKEDMYASVGREGFTLALTKQAETESVAAILKEYDIDTENWPSFLQEIIKGNFVIPHLQYKSKVIGKIDSTEPSPNEFDLSSLKDKNPKLEGAKLFKSTDGSSDKLIIKKGETVLHQFSASKIEDKGKLTGYKITYTEYDFCMFVQWPEAGLVLIKKFLTLKAILFAITNNPDTTQAQLEEIGNKAIAAASTLPRLPAKAD